MAHFNWPSGGTKELKLSSLSYLHRERTKKVDPLPSSTLPSSF